MISDELLIYHTYWHKHCVSYYIIHQAHNYYSYRHAKVPKSPTNLKTRKQCQKLCRHHRLSFIIVCIGQHLTVLPRTFLFLRPFSVQAITNVDKVKVSVSRAVLGLVEMITEVGDVISSTRVYAPVVKLSLVYDKKSEVAFSCELLAMGDGVV